MAPSPSSQVTGVGLGEGLLRRLVTGMCGGCARMRVSVWRMCTGVHAWVEGVCTSVHVHKVSACVRACATHVHIT